MKIFKIKPVLWTRVGEKKPKFLLLSLASELIILMIRFTGKSKWKDLAFSDSGCLKESLSQAY